MAMTFLPREEMLAAFEALGAMLPREVTLIVGGGAAMVLAHGFAVRTADVDGQPRGMSVEELAPFVRRVAEARGLPSDWLNPYFSTFAYVLPADYGTRLVEVFRGRRLVVQALGAEDLLVMKCFAGRQKDVAHARVLLKRVREPDVVDRRIDELVERRVPRAREAADFLDDLRAEQP